MGYSDLKSCVADLEKNGQLIRILHEIDPFLEAAEIQRRVYQARGPAIYFQNLKGTSFPAVSNLFGTLDRARFIFRDTFESVKRIIQLKAEPKMFFRSPKSFARVPFIAIKAFPKRIRSGPILDAETTVGNLPMIQSWPDDGGPFITLPQVYSEDPSERGVFNSNLGMYRVQLRGNEYQENKEVGLHYQIHRGIGVHHSIAAQKKQPLKVSVFIGGPPAHSLAAVMPLPEGLSELLFAGMIGNRRFRYIRKSGWVLSGDADFCLTGTIDPEVTLPEGPFGDHLGYYSLKHEFPVMKIDSVYHRRGAVWPFTVVGRPPQEDTTFGHLIHELTAPMVPREIPGLKAMHAVDAAGVHPLLLALGSERYVPYRENESPQELLTIANAVLGFGQASLAKFLWICTGEDEPDLKVHHIAGFLRHMLERVDWKRDLHFQTQTTMDTLDYSGIGLNQGSKLVIAAAGRKRRKLGVRLPDIGEVLPGDSPHMNLVNVESQGQSAGVLPGVLILQCPVFENPETEVKRFQDLSGRLGPSGLESSFPLIVLADDAHFTGNSLNNFLWVTFSRANPSHDVHGVDSFFQNKHWGCRGSLIIDARIKPHHAPPLIEDSQVTRKVDALATAGGPLHGII